MAFGGFDVFKAVIMAGASLIAGMLIGKLFMSWVRTGEDEPEEESL